MYANSNLKLADPLFGEPHPKVEGAPSGAVAEGRTTGCPAAKKVLLVDDDPGVREVLERVLKSEHYEVVLAKGGNEAAMRFITSQPDLVLLDLNMPDRDGWSAFRFMQAAYSQIPVIVITARPNQYAQAQLLGVDAMMEKPLNLQVLLKAIRDLLAESEAERTRRLTNPISRTKLLNHDVEPTEIAPHG